MTGACHGYQIENIWPQSLNCKICKEANLSAHIRLIPVEGITELPDIPSDEALEARKRRNELVLLNVTTVMAVLVVSFAWVLLSLD